MLKNYFLSALRHFRKNKNFSLLNTFGLALGMSCSILIFLWIQNEVSYNKFHEHRDRLYQVMDNQTYEGKTYTFTAVPGLLAGALKAEMPEIKYAARAGWGDWWLFAKDDKRILETGLEVDPDFLKMFTFPLSSGNPNTALSDPNSILITERMAKKFFGNENPVGKTLKVNNKQEFTVSGVLRDVPENSSIKFDWLVSFANFEKENPWYTQWGSNGMQTFVELHPDADPAAVNKKMYGFIQTKESDAAARIFLFSANDWRLRGKFEEGKQAGGRIEYVNLFGTIALLIIIVACINFMNLATARSEQRAKEVGVRKTLGANRRMLVLQFIGESTLMSFIAMLLACGIVLLTLPLFNKLVEQELSLNFARASDWALLGGIALVCGLLAGSYPSLYLSSFSPLSVFRGFRSGKFSRALFIRKGLVVTQFVVSISLIVSAVIIYQQIEHVKNRHLGYRLDNLVTTSSTKKAREHLDALRSDMLATGAVTHIALADQDIYNMGSSSGDFTWPGKDESKEVLITVTNVSPGFFATAGMTMKAGRDFGPVTANDSSSVVINETFARLMGMKEPVGSVIRHGDRDVTIVGLVKDFIFNDMYRSPDPVLFYCNPASTNRLFVRLKGGENLDEQLAQAKTVYAKYAPEYPFEYRFVDQEFARLFKSEMLIGKLSRLFAALTIIISCVGLFGLAAYTAERRTKEIGIRKVLGARVVNLVALLSKDFLLLVLIAILLAAPLAGYFMHEWLQGYAYRIDMSVWMFVAAGIGAMLIAVLTVSFQAIRAAVANPVKSLRTE